MTSASHTDSGQSTPVLVTATVPASELGLSETFDSRPSLTITRAQYAVSGARSLFPLVWIDVADTEVFMETLADDASLRSVTRVLETDGRTLWRLYWSDSVESVSELLIDGETILLSGDGTDKEWHLELLFPSRSVLTRVCERCESSGVSYSIDRIRDLQADDPRVTEAAPLGLTEEQFVAITTAHELGYFTVPRDVTLDEVADALGVSHQALSERLRRAQFAILEAWINTPGVGLGGRDFDDDSSDG
ncbi:helix-turn-helix domain-containing protein [Halocatena halophila]|uniref:helix-turn-helix domain-containing protein n=1 Tax=Halocatena halophila TaxID=2814576 RepID=UPI002ED26063